MDSDRAFSRHPVIQNPQSGSSRSDQQALTQLTKGDLAIVVFVLSLWLWTAVWAITAPEFR